ncbi:unnamed protein product [Mytilus coruscus]|uniref:Uncharacterized protein n=1 Tax=Mytilus coruscus TaxID=42192 RepID=A0A6J8BMG6_MYTCO|nr:unnamed protein product [Mytilus coruscus]
MFLKIILVLLVPAGICAAKAFTMPCASFTSPDEDPYNHREEIKDSRLSCKYYRCNNGSWVEGYRECSFEGQCKKKGSTWESNCIKYRCDFNITNNPEGPIYQENIISEASCKWGRKCIKVDEIVEKDCLKYKCHIDYTTDEWGVRHINRHVRLESKACFGINNKKSCIPIGQKEQFVCSTYECKQSRNFMEMVLTSYGCPSNGTCKGDNEKWTDEKCVERICKITKRSNGSYYRKNDIVKPNCKDADGYCVPIGQKLSAMVDGVRYDDCKCSRKGRNGNQVTCSKTVIKSSSITHT